MEKGKRKRKEGKARHHPSTEKSCAPSCANSDGMCRTLSAPNTENCFEYCAVRWARRRRQRKRKTKQQNKTTKQKQNKKQKTKTKQKNKKTKQNNKTKTKQTNQKKQKQKKKPGTAGNRTRGLSHPKRESCL